eukprot:5918496-Alexandrium_andersonii.AAC.1
MSPAALFGSPPERCRNSHNNQGSVTQALQPLTDIQPRIAMVNNHMVLMRVVGDPDDDADGADGGIYLQCSECDTILTMRMLRINGGTEGSQGDVWF